MDFRDWRGGVGFLGLLQTLDAGGRFRQCERLRRELRKVMVMIGVGVFCPGQGMRDVEYGALDRVFQVLF
jgi:hypothetical protein